MRASIQNKLIRISFLGWSSYQLNSYYVHSQVWEKEKFIIVGAWLTIIVFFGLVFIPNLYVKYVFVIAFGLTYFKNIETYVMATEFAPVRHKVVVTTIILCANSLVMPVTAFYFRFISRDWRWIFYVYTAITTVISILANFVPESPRYLYEKEKYTEARFVINKMAHMNSKSELVPGTWIFDKERDYSLHLDKLNYSYSSSQLYESRSVEIEAFNKKSIEEKLTELNVKEKESPIAIMKNNPVIFFNLIIIMLSWVAASFNNYLLSFSIRNFGGNLYYNAWAFGIAGLGGKIAGGVARKYLSTKFALIVMLGIVFLFGFGLIFFKNQYLIATCIGFIELGIGACFTLVYFVTTEYFPPLFTSFAFAV